MHSQPLHLSFAELCISCKSSAAPTRPSRSVISLSDSFVCLTPSSQVKGGGHTTNAGFSSTNGVQITMSRFSNVDYDSNSQTVTYGTGLIWDDVYQALEPFGVNVVGGRVTGVGVAGFSLGGG